MFHIIDRHKIMKKIHKNSFEKIILNANICHSFLRLLFWFSFFFFQLWGFILQSNYIKQFFVEIIFESLKNLLILQ